MTEEEIKEITELMGYHFVGIKPLGNPDRPRLYFDYVRNEKRLTTLSVSTYEDMMSSDLMADISEAVEKWQRARFKESLVEVNKMMKQLKELKGVS